MNNTITITRSRSGIPCLFERGGGYTNIGAAQIITDHHGYPKRAICVRTRGDLACKEHAVIPVREGDHVVTVDRRRDKVAVKVERIDAIHQDTATVVPEQGPLCYDAIQAAVAKSKEYHCRTPYYIRGL